ncbi:MAG: Maf family nucleotide pyrophosphatase [Flavobacteriaceae bacterium]|nr:Maf family nucleotide pyrophosphatase [Flavobacteriaceae bacterium]
MTIPKTVDIILGSGSPRRQNLLEQLKVKHRVELRTIDEKFDPALQAEQITDDLAQQKGKVFQHDLNPDQLVITADTIVWFEGIALGKPKSQEEAKQMLLSLSGKTHRVISSVCFSTANQQHTINCFTDVKFTDLNEELVDQYVATGSPMDKAGSYGIQDTFGLYAVSEINGSYTNVMGLPCMQTFEALHEFVQNYF